MKRLLALVVLVILCAACFRADAQVGGTMLALQARPPVASQTSPMLTGNGHGMTFGGQGGTE